MLLEQARAVRRVVAAGDDELELFLLGEGDGGGDLAKVVGMDDDGQLAGEHIGERFPAGVVRKVRVGLASGEIGPGIGEGLAKALDAAIGAWPLFATTASPAATLRGHWMCRATSGLMAMSSQVQPSS